MRKIILFFTLCFLIVNNSFSQNYNWITPNKTYLKLFINSDGIYRLNTTDFSNAGINPATIDPRTVKVLYKGNQIPIFFHGEDDGSFDPADFFDFYGVRNHGGTTLHRDAFSNSVAYTTNEYYNLYSDTNVYWIDWGGSNGLRMERSLTPSSINYPDNYFFKKVHFEKDNFYTLGETTNSLTDFRYFSNELVVAEGWFWQGLTTDQTLSDTLSISDLNPAPHTCNLKLLVFPVSYNLAAQNEHRIEIKINNTVYDTLISDSLRRIDTTIAFPSSLLTNNSVNSVTLHYIPVGSESFYPFIDVDFFELTYQRDFTIRNNILPIDLNGADSTSKKITVTGINSANPINIYDTKNNIRIENYSVSSNILTFSGKSNSSFQIVNNNITKKPFKIVTRQVKDLVSTSNAADYLIVYNKLFESQSEQLKNHRETFDNYRVTKAEIQDIYDVFNYGLEDPAALRNFVKYASENWKSPAVKYLCLFGRASLDPKKNSTSSEFYQNFVPTYGNPPSDGYFVNFNMGTFTYYHQLSVGRLPVYNTTEAQNVVDKIINYDTHQPDKWWKTYLAITGGPDRNQQILYQLKSENLLNNYIKPPPLSMQVERIYRNDSAGYITYNYKDSIKKEIDRGALIVNFIGHAASQDWEIGLENPNTLNNGNKQPLILSFTCFTGKCAEPNFRSFGENFFLIPNKCAIGFVGTTGWSFSGNGDQFNDYIHRNFARDSVRRIGDLVSYASRRLGSDSSNFLTRNTINCYNLIGDPATKLVIPRTPEFEIKQNDYALSNPFPALGENVKLTIFPKNLGTYVDSMKIRFQIRKSGVPVQTKDTLIKHFAFIDTVNYFFSIDTIGNYSMSVVLDPARTFPQEFTNNDSISFALTLRNLSYVPLKPLNNSLLKTTSFKFTGLNPNVNPVNNNIKLVLLVDTSKLFSSPILQTFNSTGLTGVTTSFNVNIPVQDLNTLYFLKTNAVINGDSSGWSDIQKFIYNPGIGDKRDAIADSVYTIYTAKPQQYNEQDLVNVSYTPEGFVLNKAPGNLFIRSYGSNGNEASFFTITNVNYYSDGGANVGLNIAKVKKLTGRALEIRNFIMNSPASSDSVVNFLNTFDTTQYVMAYIAAYDAVSDSIRQNAKAKFREFGSIYLDSVVVNFFDTWAFIGYLGAKPTQTCEHYHSFNSNSMWQPSECQINPFFQSTSGSVSQNVGPADRWKYFSWEQILAVNSSISFDVYGISRDKKSTILYSNLTNNSFINLDSIDPYVYPNLRLETKMAIDTLNGFDSPVLKSVNTKYIPPAELVADNYSFKGSDTVVQEGDSVRFSVNYYNVGYIDAPQYISRWYIKQPEVRVLKEDTLNLLQVDSMRSSQVKFSTSGLRNSKSPSDTLDLYFELKLDGNRNEIFSYNNTAITRFVIQGDTVKPLIDVAYDGIKIQNGDFIQSKPTIVFKIFDDSRMVIHDTSNVKVFLDNRYVPYFISGIRNPDLNLTFPDDRFLQATVTYKPTLSQGEHKLRYVASDLSGNISDSIVNIVEVDNNLKIHDIANYPNPMKTETNFMFMLSGEQNPTTCKVKIYSVAGRLIREINTPAYIGYNHIFWDGKDNDGDFISNGTYLYKFIIEGNAQVETSIQKLAVLR